MPLTLLPGGPAVPSASDAPGIAAGSAPHPTQAPPWQLLLDSSTDPVYVRESVSCRSVAANAAFAALIGRPAAEVPGLYPWDWDVQLDRTTILLRAREEAGRHVRFETRIRRSDGRELDVEVTGLPVLWQGVSYRIAIVIDIGARKVDERLAREGRWRRLAMDCAIDGIAIVELDTLATCEVNEAFVRSLGRSRERLVGLRPWDWGLGLDRDTLDPLPGEGSHRRIVVEHACLPSGDGRCVTEFDVTRFAVGGRDYLYWIARDQTARVAAEEALDREVRRRRKIVDANRDGILMLDTDGRVHEANPALARLLGCTQEDLLHRHVGDFAAPGERDALLARLRDPALTDELFATVLQRSDGHRLPVEISRTVIDWHGERLVHDVIRDVSERLATERALREREELFHAIVTQAPDGLTLIDAETLRFVEFNDAACAGLGYSREAFTTLSLHDVQQGLEPETVRMRVAQLLADGSAVFENTHRRRDGTTRLARVSLRAVRIREHDYFIDFWTDITEQRRIESELAAREELYAAIVTGAPDGVVLIDPATHAFVEFNDRACDMHGYPRGQFAGLTVADLLIESPAGESERYLRELAIAGAGVYEVEHRHRDGSRLAVRVSVRGLTIRKRRYFLALWTDVTSARRLESELRHRVAWQRALLDNFPFEVWLKDADGRFLAANLPAALALGCERVEDLIGRRETGIAPGPASGRHAADERTVLEAGSARTVEEPQSDRRGRLRWMEIYRSPVLIDARVAGTVGFSRDITDRRLAERAALAREQEFRTLVEHSPDAIVRYDAELRRVYVNPAFCRLTGRPAHELLGVSVDHGTGLVDVNAYRQALRNAFDSGDEAQIEVAQHNQDGTQGWSLVRFAPERGDYGNVETVLVIIRDISEIVARREAVHRLAYSDTLTGLPNRALFNDRLGRLAADARRHERSFALLLIDLDHFKDVNDTLGHGAGDALLCEVARRLGSRMRQSDTLARLGGDEFAVLLPETSTAPAAATVAARLLDALAAPASVAGRELAISASIGIALYPHDGTELDDLVACADAAMYEAKRKGRNTWQIHAREVRADAVRRLALGAALHGALARAEFELWYQPKVCLPDGRVLGAEALLRWRHPEHGLLAPDHFIGIAEDGGHIVELGGWVLETACRAVLGWRAAHPALHVAVNVSPRQVMHLDLAERVQAVLAATGCPPQALEIELTESVLLADDARVHESLERVRALGVRIALDDFGTGYSALAYLDRIRVDVLKIDRSFVRDIDTEARRERLVEAFVSVARALGIDTVAEGVETAAQAGIVHRLGCGAAQGYLYGRPMPAKAFADWLAAAHARG